MRKCDVILTYTWNRVSYNILKSLAAKGLKVVVGDTSKYTICSLSNMSYSSFVYPDPFTREEEFIRTLTERINEWQPAMLIPTHDEGIIIAKHRDKFPERLIIGVDRYDKIIALSDKEVATGYAGKLGIPIPRIYGDISEIKEFPVVFKTRIGNSAKGVFFPKNRSELSDLSNSYKASEVMVQEYIPGTDHSVDCIRTGDFFFASVYKAVLTKTNGGGTTTQRVIVDRPELVGYSKTLLDYVDYQGVCGLDFKYDEQTGKCAFIEVNARYTGGLATPVCAGFDIPYIHYCLSLYGKYENPVDLKIGTKTKWILGDIITFVERVLNFKLSRQELRSLCNFRFDGFDDYSAGDRRAILGECLYYFMKLIQNRKLNP